MTGKSVADKPSELTGEVEDAKSDETYTMRVRLVKAVRLPANYSATVAIQVCQVKGTVLLQPSLPSDQALKIEQSLLEVKEDGTTAEVIVNNSSSSCQLGKGMELGHVSGVEVVNCTPRVPFLTEQSLPAFDDSTNNCGEMQQFLDKPNVYSVSTAMNSECTEWRHQQLGKLLRNTHYRVLYL